MNKPNNQEKTGFIGNSPISIGRYTYGYENLSIKQWGEGASLKIGAFCSIASNVTIFLGGNHRSDWISTYPFGHIYEEELGAEKIPGHPSTNGNVNIGSDVWIGSGVTIMSGINIGDGSIIAANSTVIKNVAPYEITGGNPAKFIKYRFEDQIISKLLHIKWWELPIEDIIKIKFFLSEKPTIDNFNLLQKTISY